MLFSIIVPTYNRADLILTTLHSILMQTYPDFEVIVVDDGSTDNTQAVVGSIRDKRVQYYLKNNEERAAARNFGTQRANGAYITFLDSDDVLMPQHLQEARQLIEAQQQPEWFHLKYEIVDSFNRFITNQSQIYKKGELNKQLFFTGNFLSCMGVFLRKDVALNNLFTSSKQLSISEDHELWLRIAAQYPLKVNDVVTAKLIQHNNRSVNSMDKQVLIMGKETALHAILSNGLNQHFIKGQEHKVRSSAYSYIALHLALSGKHKRSSLRYLGKSFRANKSIVLSRRFLAIVKHLIFTR